MDRNLECTEAIDPRSEMRCSPNRDEERQNNPRRRRTCHHSRMILIQRARQMTDVLTGGIENALWLPNAEKQNKDNQADNGSADINQPRTMDSCNEKLRKSKGNACNQN